MSMVVNCGRKFVWLQVVSIMVAGILPALAQAAAEAEALRDAQGHPVEVTAEAFKPRAGDEAAPFTRYDGGLFGLRRTNSFGPEDFFPPFFNGQGLSSGDIDRDGWPDVVSASGSLINIYMNQEGRRFVPQELDVTGDSDATVFSIALVDLNGDGWLDLFASTYLGGNFYLLNDKGSFTLAGLQKPPRGQSVLSLSTSFGDLDQDGDLDAVMGNWFAGMGKQHPPPQSQNEIWIKEGDQFVVTPLVDMVGETLSTLLSDWSGDGKLDLIIGNDFDVPDFYYLGDGKGGFERSERTDGVIPQSTHSTMSIDTGDFDNDLDLDIFLDQITARATGASARLVVRPLKNYCDDIVDQAERDRCLVNIKTRDAFFYGTNHRPANVRKCAAVSDPADEQACIAMQVNMTAQRLRDPKICESIPKTESRTYTMCINFFEPVFPHDPETLMEGIYQARNENVLLAWDASKQQFTDEAERTGVSFTGWSWNARFVDVDNDEWQDLFIAAGSWFRATRSGTTANFFFHNQGGQQFIDKTDDFGLQNFMIVSAYTTLDFDKDGDLDFITNSINGPLWLLRNNSGSGNSIVFRLRDEVGNRDGIGTKFVIHYGVDAKRHQMRELKASGGYLSFDEPLAHFGLGEYDSVERLEIHWSTGGKTIIPGPFDAGHAYSLQRLKE